MHYDIVVCEEFEKFMALISQRESRHPDNSQTKKVLIVIAKQFKSTMNVCVSNKISNFS